MPTTTLSYFIRHLDEFGLDDKTELWITADDGGTPMVDLDYDEETLSNNLNRLIVDISTHICMSDYKVKYWTITGNFVNVTVTKRAKRRTPVW
ncbi:MAG: hypothetical protein K2F99_09960 [Muribaculaceae bacterium]|nr:hypothetical protein [Muribaculaceae bacterium]